LLTNELFTSILVKDRDNRKAAALAKQTGIPTL